MTKQFTINVLLPRPKNGEAVSRQLKRVINNKEREDVDVALDAQEIHFAAYDHDDVLLKLWDVLPDGQKPDACQPYSFVVNGDTPVSPEGGMMVSITPKSDAELAKEKAAETLSTAAAETPTVKPGEPGVEAPKTEQRTGLTEMVYGANATDAAAPASTPAAATEDKPAS